MVFSRFFSWGVLVSGLVLLGGARAGAQSGLVAHYRFDGNASDSSGFGHHGAVSNASFVPGRFGGGIEFSGGDDSYVEVPHSPLLSPADGVTVSVWARIEQYDSSYTCMVYKAAAAPQWRVYTDRSYTLWAGNTDSLHLASAPAGGGTHDHCDSPAGHFQVGEWAHFAAVVDATQQRMALFIDGLMVSECAYSGNQIQVGDWPLRIGGYFSTNNDQGGFHGVLDEVKIFNRALSDAQVAELAFALDADPEIVTAGDGLGFETTGGAPGQPLLLAAVAANGVPLWVVVATGTFDATCTWQLATVVPPGLAGLVVTVQSFGVAKTGRLLATNRERIEFQ